jgi:integration host factor subunit alpha
LVLKEITDCLKRGETIKLSSFGSFVVRNKRQRVGRNPKTGKETVIAPRLVLVFKPSNILRQRINARTGSPHVDAPSEEAHANRGTRLEALGGHWRGREG